MFSLYKPTWVKLPNGFSREIITRNRRNGQVGRLATKAENPTYDDYSLFYDVFFSLDKRYIWTVGPPLLFFGKKLLPIQIYYKGKNLKYKYYHYHNSTVSSCSTCFKILATSIKEKNPTLTFSAQNWKIELVVASFPLIHSEGKLTLATLQKNYTTNHIIEWVLWHYRLHQFKRILFYDNGSDNRSEVKTALQHLNLPDLEIVFVDWSYYFYGNLFPHSFGDRFAQNTHLNHVLRLHSGQTHFVAGLDLDEYLINASSVALQHLIKTQYYLLFQRYDIVDVDKELPSSIKDCTTRKKKPLPNGKYLYRSNSVKYLSSPHDILRSQFYLSSRFCFRLFHILQSKLLARFCKITKYNLYVIHAQPIKIFWKSNRTHKERPFRVAFESKIHLKDQNIQEHLKKALLTK